MTNHRTIALCLLICLCGLLLVAPAAKADTFGPSAPFVLELTVGTAFTYQDISHACNVTLTATVGNFSALAILTVTEAGGVLRFVPTTSGSYTITCTLTDTSINVNSVLVTGAQNQTYTASSLYIITWTYGGSPALPTPTTINNVTESLPVINVGWLWVFLNSGDFFGFFQALYINAFNSVDILYGMIVLLFMVPLYLRTKSLLLICILWIMLGGFFLATMPMLAGFSIVFLALGVGGLLFRLVRPNN